MTEKLDWTSGSFGHRNMWFADSLNGFAFVVAVDKEGMFCVDESDRHIRKHFPSPSPEFPTLAEAKEFCQQIEESCFDAAPTTWTNEQPTAQQLNARK